MRNGRLYGVHSNYPGVPMLGSLEIFDPEKLRPIGLHGFGRMDGSFTRPDRAPESATGAAAGRWIACFVHYGKGATAIAGRNRIVTRRGRRSSPWTTNGGARQAGRCRPR